MHFVRVKKKDSTEEILANIAECSKNAGKRLATYWVVWLYGMITLAGITDKDIFLDKGATLPIANVIIPLTGFWVVFPPIILVMFLLFALLLFRLAELRNSLPKGKNDYLREYPWVWYIGMHSKGVIGFVRIALVVFVSISAPLALYYNSISCLPMKIKWLTWYTEIWLIIGSFIGGAVLGQVYAKDKFSAGFERRLFGRTIDSGLFVGILIVAAIILAYTPFGAKFRSPLDVSYQILMERPQYDHSSAYWANLSNRNYQGANLISTVLRRVKLDSSDFTDAKMNNGVLDSSSLINANLESADLSGANLEYCDLRQAKLFRTRLTGVQLSHANLANASLKSLDLREASFEYADLQYSDLSKSDLSGTNLRCADLQEVNFSDAQMWWCNLSHTNLVGADLTHAVLRQSNFDSSRIWNAKLSNTDLISSSFNCADMRSIQLDSADLGSAWLLNATLSDADLSSANLSHAKMKGVNLDSANLANTNLSNVSGVTQAELARARSLRNAKGLNHVLKAQLESCCGYLFVNPDSVNRMAYPPFGDAVWNPDSIITK